MNQYTERHKHRITPKSCRWCNREELDLSYRMAKDQGWRRNYINGKIHWVCPGCLLDQGHHRRQARLEGRICPTCDQVTP